MKKPLRKLNSDLEAEAFVADADLTNYDRGSMRLVRFESQPIDERDNIRLPRPLLVVRILRLVPTQHYSLNRNEACGLQREASAKEAVLF